MRQGLHEEEEKRKKWRFVDKVDNIIGCKPATRPEVVLDTSVEGTASNIMSDNGDDSENESLEKALQMIKNPHIKWL